MAIDAKLGQIVAQHTHTHTHPGTIPWREEEEWSRVLRPPRLDFAAGVPRKRGNDGTDDDPCGR